MSTQKRIKSLENDIEKYMTASAKAIKERDDFVRDANAMVTLNDKRIADTRTLIKSLGGSVPEVRQ